MATYNKVIICGRLCGEIEVKYTQSQKAVCNITMATDEGTKAAPKPQFHKVVVWGKSAEFLSKYAKKGDLVLVEGSLQNREWIDKENNRRFATEIIVNNATIVNSKKQKTAVEGGIEEQFVEAIDMQAPAVDATLDDIPF